MEVILVQDVDKLGKAGERIKVRDGYSRNFLIPNRLAVLATEGGLKFLEAKKKRAEAEAANALADMRDAQGRPPGEDVRVQRRLAVDERQRQEPLAHGAQQREVGLEVVREALEPRRAVEVVLDGQGGKGGAEHDPALYPMTRPCSRAGCARGTPVTGLRSMKGGHAQVAAAIT